MVSPSRPDTAPAPRPATGWPWRRVYLRERLPEVLVLTLGLLISLTVAWAARDWDGEQRTERLREDVAVYAQAMQQQLQSLVTAVQVLAQFYDHSDEVRADEFDLFARPFLERTPGIQALAWVPRVQAAERSAFEAQARAEGPADFAIRELAGADLRRATARPDYFPVRRVVPLAGNARVLGFDVGSEPLRRAALERARDTGQTVAAVPLALVQEQGEQRGLLIFVPSARAGALGATAQERRQRLQGFAVGVMRLGEMMDGVVAALPPRRLELVLSDPGLPGAGGVLHAHWSPTRGPAAALHAAPQAPDALADEALLAVADRTLVLRARAAPGAYPPGGWPLVLLGLGLVMTAALFALLGHRRRTAARLREREELFRLFMDQSPTVAWIKDDEGRCVYLNRTFERRFGVRLQDWRGRTDRENWPPDLAERFSAADRQVLAGDGPLDIDESVPAPDGGLCEWRTTKFAFRRADGRRLVGGIGMDVTARKQAELQLEEALREAQLARLDALTGITNRAGFDDEMEQGFARAQRQGRRFGLVFLDLDGFKAINDTRGHQVGDQVLQAVAGCLSRHCRPGDLTGRYGGDEFAILLPDLPDAATAVAIAERLRAAVAALNWGGCAVSASVGVALYPDHAQDLPGLIRQADLAMYASKDAGKDRVTLADTRPTEAPVVDLAGSGG